MNRMLSPSLNHPSLKKLRKYRRHELDQQAHTQAYKSHRERTADTASENETLQKHWFATMKMAFEEMDQVFKLTAASEGFEFLDVGCCPGGFSSYILNTNSKAVGTGLSLPVAGGGHAFLLEPALHGRYSLIWGDLNKYQLGPLPLADPTLMPFPITPHSHPNGFALVLLDGHPLRTAAAGPEFYLVSDRLLIAQLIVGLMTVVMGGTIVIKLSAPERIVSAQLLWMFDALCADVRTWKPVCIHGPRSTFYAIAHGVGYGKGSARYSQLLEGLKVLWVVLGYSEGGMGRRLQAGDLNFIVDEEELQTVWLGRLTELSAHLWDVQATAWKGWKGQVARGL